MHNDNRKDGVIFERFRHHHRVEVVMTMVVLDLLRKVTTCSLFLQPDILLCDTMRTEVDEVKI